MSTKACYWERETKCPHIESSYQRSGMVTLLIEAHQRAHHAERTSMWSTERET